MRRTVPGDRVIAGHISGCLDRRRRACGNDSVSCYASHAGLPTASGPKAADSSPGGHVVGAALPRETLALRLRRRVALGVDQHERLQGSRSMRAGEPTRCRSRGPWSVSPVAPAPGVPERGAELARSDRPLRNSMCADVEFAERVLTLSASGRRCPAGRGHHAAHPSPGVTAPTGRAGRRTLFHAAR